MHYAYLFATILGGVLLGASIVGADHHDGDTGGDTGHDSDGVASLFSLRTWTYFLAFGGGTGLLLSWLTGAGVVLTAVLAAGVGAASSLTARLTIRHMLRSGEGGTVQQHELVGRSAQVLVPADKGKTGTVRLRVKNSTVDLMAFSDDGDLGVNDEVLIVDMKDGRALVTGAPEAQKRLGPKP
jgi:membrane protein implicated in regulation of membrane protease activity